ncbi:phage terminase small subunit [Pasteurella multocida]|uniref:phage terminase small subunit n=1 Tax=Pasteurella multocida TaxID=747 RepID=UPI00225BFF19|nr:terminase endonuclease subunit [Pasteurella multocida]UZT19502.1 terminase endonuclease subunit [Pasteurella multocida]UZU35553.1 terminase endonuclease subunit [Pasteurella multocida]UZU38507.1 terminase endonuclease subunit [Pasteurella multocida]UZU42540.1 terminase endonuclease subunit [Pasteurella multocida]UZV58749.1 terminase endonuclease subunit [Pasteurella multocida]
MGVREFQEKIRALEQIQKATNDGTLQSEVVAQHSNDYTVLEIALANDVNAIRAIPTLELRAEHKRNRFLPKWLPFVDEYLEKKAVYQNDYFAYCIIYLFDVGDFDKALALSEIAIEQKQSLPACFNSTLPNFVADQIFNWANKTASAGGSVEPYFTQVFENVATKWQLHEIVKSKWLKMAAALLLRNENGEVKASGIDDQESLILAIKLCIRAFQLNHKSGVKSMIERCYMRLSALEKEGKFTPNELTPLPALGLETVEINFSEVVKKLRRGQLNDKEEVKECSTAEINS